MTFGKLGELNPAKARQKATELLSRVRLGGDPAGDKIEVRAHANETFGVIVERYLARQEARLRPNTCCGPTRSTRPEGTCGHTANPSMGLP
jgi:hypothetical protein